MRKHGIIALAAAALIAGTMATVSLSIANAAASGRVIGMTSGGGNKGCGVVTSPGISTTNPVKSASQTFTVTCVANNIQCHGLATPGACPSSATITSVIKTPPISCKNLSAGSAATEKFTATVKQSSSSSKPSGSTKVTFKTGTLYTSATGSVKNFDGLTKVSAVTAYQLPTGACGGAGGSSLITSLTAFTIVTFTN